jgi:hypothetical protein
MQVFRCCADTVLLSMTTVVLVAFQLITDFYFCKILMPKERSFLLLCLPFVIN